jgi:hypothetical protein
MAVNIDIFEVNGPFPGVEDDLVLTGDIATSSRGLVFGRNDDRAPSSIVKPLRGVKRSYEKYLKITASSLGAGERISNLQLFASGPEYSSGVTVQIGTAANYAAPVDTDSALAVDGIFTKTTVSPLLITPVDQEYSIDANPDSNQIALHSQLGSYLVLQMDVRQTAKIGALGTQYDPVSLVIRYDEA